ncbi:MAG TPA: hypothetical protein VH062_37765 [Polyangiaceae bacterium]|jgi:hypothetical protein|nr:hypothetical protein [Polyangiaceae bacterium]
MLAALWGALGAGAVGLALIAAFCQFGAILVVRPNPSVSLKAVRTAVACAVLGLGLGFVSHHAAWYFIALATSMTGFAALYLLALLGSLSEFERRDMNAVIVSVSIFGAWLLGIIALWASSLPGIGDAADFWVRIAEWPFKP